MPGSIRIFLVFEKNRRIFKSYGFFLFFIENACFNGVFSTYFFLLYFVLYYITLLHLLPIVLLWIEGICIISTTEIEHIIMEHMYFLFDISACIVPSKEIQ